MSEPLHYRRVHVAMTAFLALFSLVGIATYGLPFFYDFFVKDLGWTRAEVTSGNAFSRLVVGPVFGFIAGWIVDRFGPRRLMLFGILIAGAALVGLGAVSTIGFFYVCYLLNALGYVCGGPLPNQVLLSRWFDRNRGKAMGFAYLGIGVGGTIVPLLAYWLTTEFGWRSALQILGVLMIVIAFPMAWFVRDAPDDADRFDATHARPETPAERGAMGAILRSPAFYLLAVGSMCSIGAVGGTMQNLKLFFSLDVKLSQAEVAQIMSLVLAGSLIGRDRHGRSGGPLGPQARDAPHLLYRRARDSAAVPRRTRRGPMGVRAALRHRPRRRLHDHPADGRRSVRRQSAGAADGDRAHG